MIKLTDKFLGVNKESGLKMASTPGKDAMKIVEMSTVDLEYFLNLLDKAAAGFERIGSNFERSFIGKMPSNSIQYYRELFVKGTLNVAGFTVLKKLPQPPQPSASPP